MRRHGWLRAAPAAAYETRLARDCRVHSGLVPFHYSIYLFCIHTARHRARPARARASLVLRLRDTGGAALQRAAWRVPHEASDAKISSISAHYNPHKLHSNTMLQFGAAWLHW